MKLFEPKVYFDEEQNKYFHKQTGEQYERVSHVLDSLGKPFDEYNISGYVAKSKGVSREEILDFWGKNRDEGTRVHNAIEHYGAYAKVRDEDSDLLDISRDINATYKDYYQSYSELTLYNEETKTSGRSDRISVLSKTKNSWFDVDDYKRPAEEAIKFYSNSNETMHPPFNYLQNCTYVRYSLQLSTYAYMFEQLTGMRCRSLTITVIKNDNKNFFRVPVMYMKPEVEHIFRERKKQLANGQ